MKTWAIRSALLLATATCGWVANQRVCNGCSATEIRLSLSDATPIYGRLHVPHDKGNGLPAVIVSHGYLANLGFVEIPWAEDLNNLGVVALFIDRRGHGWSGGRLWPSRNPRAQLRDASPEIAAAVSYLRSRAPLVDPSRIALVGHSDGATSAILAASADWDIAATVSLSASAAPWQFVNHVAPANLLLLYGADDRFILEHTDRLLIQSATRGYLDDAGSVGDISDGSARRLTRVAGRGHIGLVYSDAARRQALDWIAQTFGIRRQVVLSPAPVPWVVAATILLGMLVLLWNGGPQVRSMIDRHFQPWLILAAMILLWGGGLWLAARYDSMLRSVPAQEGNVVAATLIAECVLMIAIAVVVISARRAWSGLIPQRALLNSAGRGAAAGILFQMVFEIVLQPVYEAPIGVQRLALFGLFLPIALASFGALAAAGLWVTTPSARVPAPFTEFSLAAVTVLSAEWWFPRMAALPVYLLAASIALMGAYRAGRHPGGSAGAAAFGAVIYARCMSFVCALY